MQDSYLFYTLGANILVSLVSFIGVLTLVSRKLASQQAIESFVGFAAGVLLATSFLDILPEALEHMDAHMALQWAMGGIVLAFFMERFLLWYHHHHEDSHNMQPKAVLVIVGDAVHNFIDGLAISAAFFINPFVGASTLAAIVAHEIPQELADFGILRHSGLSYTKALLWNFASGLFSLIGGLVGIFVLRNSPDFAYPLLAITAGLFIYVSSADLIPELHSSSRTKGGWARQSFMFVLGIAVMVGVGMLGGH